VKSGRVVGVIEDGEERATAADAVVSTQTGESLAELSAGAGVTKKARESWPRIEMPGGRFVVSLVVNDRGLPVPLPRESFLVRREESLPDLHVQRFSYDDLAEKRRSGDDTPREPQSLLVAEMLLPTTGGIHLLGAREAVLASLRSYLPFLDEHLVCVDSPHDGLPASRYQLQENGERSRIEIQRIHLKGAQPTAEAMVARLNVNPPGYLGLAAEPLRGPIPGTYLVGPSVLPGLGQEGEVLAAWGVAKILTKKDGSRQKLRRQMWTKIETG
jgi:hypothetical protein